MRPAPNPAAVTTALIAVFTRVAATPVGDPTFDAAQVYDGPAPESGYARQWLAVGMPWEADQLPVTVRRTESGASRRGRLDYAVACAAYAGAGDPGFDQYRDQVTALVAAVDGELSRDRTLGGLVGLAGIADMALSQGADAHGYGAMAAFTITATAI